MTTYYDRFNKDKGWKSLKFVAGRHLQSAELNEIQSIESYNRQQIANFILKDGQVMSGMSILVRSSRSISGVAWTRNGTVVTVYSPNHLLLQNEVINVDTTSDNTVINTGPISILSATSNYFTLSCSNTGATSGTITYTQDKSPNKIVTIDSGTFYLSGLSHEFSSESIEITGVGEEVIGIIATSTIVTETEDSTLLDPAIGQDPGYGLPGAHREVYTYSLALNDNSAIPIYKLIDGEVVEFPRIDPYATFYDILARRTNDESGSYMVNGFRGSITSKDSTYYNLVISAGKAYVKGYYVIKPVDVRVPIRRPLDAGTITDESHTYNTGTSAYSLYITPVKTVNAVKAQVRRVTGTGGILQITRGGTVGGTDVILDPSEGSIVGGSVTAVHQGGTSYTVDTDYIIIGNSISWSPGGSEPATGSSYDLTYDIIKLYEEGADYTTSSTGIDISLASELPVNGSLMLISYSPYLARYDLVSVDQKGNIVITEGTPAYNLSSDSFAYPPAQPVDNLLLGVIYLPPNALISECIYKNSGIYRKTMEDLISYGARIKNLEYNMAVTDLEVNAWNIGLASSKIGLFTDNLSDWTKQDLGYSLTLNGTWSRSTTVATITLTSHKYYPGITIEITASSSVSAIPLGSYTVVTTPTSDTFTITVQNAGAASGTCSFTDDFPASLDFENNVAPSYTMDYQELTGSTGRVILNYSNLITAVQLGTTEDILVNEYQEFNTGGIISLSPQDDISINNTTITIIPSEPPSTATRTTVPTAETESAILTLYHRDLRSWWEKLHLPQGIWTYFKPSYWAAGYKTTTTSSTEVEIVGTSRAKTVSISGFGFVPHSDNLALTFEGTPKDMINRSIAGTNSGTVKADAGGSFTAQFNVEAGIVGGGKHVIVSNPENSAEAIYSIGTINRTTTITTRVVYICPVAQTFTLKDTQMISGVDLYFTVKDPNIPIRVSLNNVINGYPGPETLAEVIVNPADINIPTSGTIGNVATQVRFPDAAYCEGGQEYCIVISSNSNVYRIAISRLGNTDLTTGSVVIKNPYAGTLFTSANSTTWSPDQSADLKFVLYRSDFSGSNLTKTVTYDQLTVDGSWFCLLGDEVTPSGTSTKWYYSANSGSWKPLALGVTVDTGVTLTTLRFKVDITGTDYVSPTISDNIQVLIGKWDTQGRYIGRNTNVTVLGASSYTDLDIYLDQRPAGTGSSIAVYYSKDEGDTWVTAGAGTAGATLSDGFTEYHYNVTGISGPPTNMKLRIDMISANNRLTIPYVRRIRMIAS